MISSLHSEHTYGSDLRKDMGKLLRRGGRHRPLFHHDIVRVRSFMNCKDIVDYKKIRDSKTPLTSCFPFLSKLKRLAIPLKLDNTKSIKHSVISSSVGHV